MPSVLVAVAICVLASPWGAGSAGSAGSPSRRLASASTSSTNGNVRVWRAPLASAERTLVLNTLTYESFAFAGAAGSGNSLIPGSESGYNAKDLRSGDPGKDGTATVIEAAIGKVGGLCGVLICSLVWCAFVRYALMRAEWWFP